MKTKMFNFYLGNYKSIHHLITISMIFSFMCFIDSLIVKLPLFEPTIDSFLFNFILLFLSYKVTNFTLDKSGLDTQIQKEIKKKQTI
jgi:hypothetical protein